MAFQTKLMNGLQEFMKNIQDQINQFKTDVNDYIKLCVVPVGSVMMYMGKGSSAPKGWLFCDGSTVSAETYPELYALIGSKTPNMTSKFPMGTNTASDVGVSVAAGLPNITGKHSMGSKNGAAKYKSSGSFYVESAKEDESITGGRVGDEENASKVTVVFDASRSSNSIYGKSTTVQPPAIKMRYIIKAK